jgi:hypothetical protein
MAMAVIVALSSAFLLIGISYILFPDQTSQQRPTPMPISKPIPLLNQILWTIQWIGLAAIIAITIVGAMLLINRVRNKKAVNKMRLKAIQANILTFSANPRH